jgi:hypothetical protein
VDAANLCLYVARLGSINGAAAELHTVQSNVTARSAAVSDTPRFIRLNSGLSTSYGALMRLDERVFALEMAVERALRHAARQDDLLDARLHDSRGDERCEAGVEQLLLMVRLWHGGIKSGGGSIEGPALCERSDDVIEGPGRGVLMRDVIHLVGDGARMGVIFIACMLPIRGRSGGPCSRPRKP